MTRLSGTASYLWAAPQPSIEAPFLLLGSSSVIIGDCHKASNKAANAVQDAARLFNRAVFLMNATSGPGSMVVGPPLGAFALCQGRNAARGDKYELEAQQRPSDL